MKKGIAMMLAAVMLLFCAAGLAEETGVSAETVFLRIRENVTAQVYADPQGGQAAAALESGRFCVLIDETSDIWLHVLYLNDQKKGETGYIHADDAEPVNQEELEALMEDPEKINEILDLIDALLEYGTAEAAPAPAAEKETDANAAPAERGFEKLYQNAVTSLRQVFGTDLQGTLDTAGKAAGEAAKAGRKVLESAAKDAGEMLGKAGNTVREGLSSAADTAKGLLGMAGETVRKEINEKLPGAKEKLEEIRDQAADAAGTLAGKASEAADAISGTVSDAVKAIRDGSAKEQLDDLMKNVQDAVSAVKEQAGEALNSVDLDGIRNNVDSLVSTFQEEGLQQGVQAVTDLLQGLLFGGQE